MTGIPTEFFTTLLPQINHAGELKVVLMAFWLYSRQDPKRRYLKVSDFLEENDRSMFLNANQDEARPILHDALEKATQRGFFLKALPANNNPEDAIYFINTPRGRALQKALQEGKWKPLDAPHTLSLDVERPNIFRLYEDNIGALTPLMADRLRDAEKEYYPEWIEEAFQIAVERNVRKWVYIESILRSWKERGKDESNRRDTEKNGRDYLGGEFADIIEH